MNWQRSSEYHMTTDDHAFTICKYAIGGAWFYEAWRGKRLLETRLPSADAAKAVCEQEAECV